MLSGTNDICEPCLAGRQHRERFPKTSSNRALQVLHLIHYDLVGPMPVSSLGRSRYFIVFTNDQHASHGCIS
jgi:hypothetical protein